MTKITTVIFEGDTYEVGAFIGWLRTHRLITSINLHDEPIGVMDLSTAAAELGRKGGSVTSEAKTKAAQENGRKAHAR